MVLSAAPIGDIARDDETAWNSGDPARVAASYAEADGIVINRGTPWEGRAKVAEVVAGFCADVGGMRVILDDLRVAADHVAPNWTFTCRHAASGKALDVKGWEEWDLDTAGLIAASNVWFDTEDYARQVAGSR